MHRTLLAPSIALVSLLLATCAAEREGGALGGLVLGDGAVVSGYREAPIIRVPSGAVVHVEGPLELFATEQLVIEGELRARDANAPGATDAPSIVLRAGERLAVRGRVLGGRGRSFDARPGTEAGHTGGNGSSVWLIAPDVLVTGLVRGGRGGDGAAGAPGGRGGSVSVAGSLDVGTGAPLAPGDDAASYARFEAGTGGLGGPPPMGSRPGGVPGSGGRVVWQLEKSALAAPSRPD